MTACQSNHLDKIMIITVASYKGGVAKTTTAVHLAAFLQKRKPTLLIDGDVIRAASKWGERGSGFRFKVVDEARGVKMAREYAKGHIVIDTEANPSNADFRDIVEGCDLLVIPAVPEQTATDGLIYTLSKLQEMDVARYRVLITKVPPKPQSEGVKLRKELVKNGIPVFKAEIPRLKSFDTASAKGLLISDLKDSASQRGWESYEKAGEKAGKEILNGK